MKFTLSWLKKFLETTATLDEITNALISIGLEVETVIDRRAEFQNFEVGYILKANPHPSADKLKICEIETKDGVLQIVCGAPNARSGINVVVAKVGAIIPQCKFKIKESEIRGIKSCGMLCSEEELLLGAGSEGIIELDKKAIIGDHFINYFGLDDPIIDINITPNRSDALGVYGIARDLAAKGIGILKNLEIPKITPKFDSKLGVEINHKPACPLFACREIRNLENKPSPDWLKTLLQNIGIGSISAIVDVTNYICYSFGQPMHAYDADKLSSGLIIEELDNPLQFKALNNKEYKLLKNDLIIKDKENVHCLAGIIGGEISSCTTSTKRVLLEAACFNSTFIAKTGRRLQIETDSRYRFERGVDQSFTINALNITADMIMTICGGESSQIISEGSTAIASRVFNIPLDFLRNITGVILKGEKIVEILEKLGFQTKFTSEGIKIKIPSWRHDIFSMEDIAEEVIRIYGYDKIPEIPLPQTNLTRIVPQMQMRTGDIKRIIAHRGYDEVITWSFMDSNNAKFFSDIKDELLLLNPISSDLNYMRPSIIPNLLKLTAKNLARSIKDLSLFEVGPVFYNSNLEGELLFATAVRCGNMIPRSCHSNPRQVDVFDIKTDLEIILNNFGLSLDRCQINNSNLPSYYHPTSTAAVYLGKNLIAWFGRIHPSILNHFNIDGDVLGFEINIANIPFSKPKFGRREDFKASDFQITSRDYAFIIDKDQPIGNIISYIKNINKNLIKSVDLFDIYSGDKLEANKKSIAISVQIQSNDRTLNDADLNLLSNSIITGIEQKFGARLRDL